MNNNNKESLIEISDNTTLADVFLARVNHTPEDIAYRQYRDKEWQNYSWRETCDQVARWQHAMREEGLAKGDRVAIMCANSWHWTIFDQAAQGIGLVTVPIYTNDRCENICWILKDSGAKLLLIGGQAQWEMLNRDRPEICDLPRILSLSPIRKATENLRLVSDWLPTEDCGYVLSPGKADTLATIVYTSGTTGRPKGVMLSHRNILWNLSAILKRYPVYSSDVLLSFLPLSHTLERTVGYYLPVVTGSTVAFNRSIPLLAEDLSMVQPSIMISVPRIFERIYAKISSQLQKGSKVKRVIFALARDSGWIRFLRDQKRHGWHPALLLHPLFDHLVGKKIREKLGGNLRFTVCGGAALSPEIAKVFIGLGIPVLHGYGMTETSPVISCNQLEDNLPESVGQALPGVEITTDDNNQLLSRSPSVMMGYWNNEQATNEIIDEYGWLATGDVVKIDNEKRIHITGRIKEIIVLANGEKVPPSDMENAIALAPEIEQVLLIGEGKPYLSALVVPSEEALKQLAKDKGLEINGHLLKEKVIVKSYLKQIKRQIKSFPGYAQVRRIALIQEPWTPDNGFATPTLKLRRNRIIEHHKDLVDGMYTGH